MKAKERERQEAIAQLREWLKPGDTVYTILRHVSRSGMSREIGVVILKDGADLHPNYSTAKAIDARQGKYDGVVMGGCGMDMGFALVYNLSSALWPDGFGCIGEGCRSNDHSNGDRDFMPHESAQAFQGVQERSAGNVTATSKDMPGHWHRSGGYALSQRWL